MRGTDVNIPLTLHVLGAGLLVGALLAVALAVVAGWRRPDHEAVPLTRFALRGLFVAVLPAYVLMRIGAQWTEAAEDLPPTVEDAAWITIGYITADLGAALLLIALILGGIGLRKLRSGGGLGLGRAVGVISVLLVAAYLVAVWAMSAKPE